MKNLLLVGIVVPLAACAGWNATETEPISERLPDLKSVQILVTADDSGADAAVGRFRARMISELCKRELFVYFVKDREPGVSEVRMSITLAGYRGVDPIPRFLFGCFAGKARLEAAVTLTNLKSGENLGAFKVYGKSSSATCADGTTDDAIDILAEGVAEVLKRSRARVSVDRAE